MASIFAFIISVSILVAGGLDPKLLRFEKGGLSGAWGEIYVARTVVLWTPISFFEISDRMERLQSFPSQLMHRGGELQLIISSCLTPQLLHLTSSR
jgi:hypothetical protein